MLSDIFFLLFHKAISAGNQRGAADASFKYLPLVQYKRDRILVTRKKLKETRLARTRQ